MHYKIHII